MRVLFLDLRQLGFLQPAPYADPDNHAARARNLGALVQSTDARAVVVTGVLPHREMSTIYAAHLPIDARLDIVRLRAAPDALRRRFESRAVGEGWRETGDDLQGLSADGFERLWREAVADDEPLDASGDTGPSIDTTGRPATVIADMVMTSVPGWAELSKL